MTKYQRMTGLLNDLAKALQHYQLWSDQAPAAEAFASTAPFCIDSMSFEEWLQFVFLVKMTDLIEQGLPLPRQAQLSPMVELVYQDRDVTELARVIIAIETLLCDESC